MEKSRILRKLREKQDYGWTGWICSPYEYGSK
jgi:hypothetical protein